MTASEDVFEMLVAIGEDLSDAIDRRAARNSIPPHRKLQALGFSLGVAMLDALEAEQLTPGRLDDRFREETEALVLRMRQVASIESPSRFSPAFHTETARLEAIADGRLGIRRR